MARITATVNIVAAFSVCAQPQDWSDRIAAGQMRWSNAAASSIATCYMPAVGNGFIGQVVGSQKQDTPGYGACGWLYQSGLHNGYYTGNPSPSHRAALPSTTDFVIRESGDGTFTAVGAAVDFELGLYYNRTVVEASSCTNTQIEQRQYASRVYRDLMVFEIQASAADTSKPWAGCVLPVAWTLNMTATAADVSLTASVGNVSYPSVYSGVTTTAETNSSGVYRVAQAFSGWVSNLAAQGNAATLTFSPAQTTYTILTVTHSDLDSADPSSAAVSAFLNYSGLSSNQLMDGHVAAMQQLWSSGIEMEGNATFGAVLNSSLYNILLSLRDDWPYSTGPGGISGNGYGGHTFWDEETWQLPNVLLVNPGIAQAAEEYRLQRAAVARDRAASQGYYGAQWPWQSAATGVDTGRSVADGWYEQHVGADIPLFMRQMYYVTQDTAWLGSAWSALRDTCHFWACRFTRSDSPINSTAPYPGPGQGLNCSSKAGSGNFTIRGIIPPDEAAQVEGLVDDNPYTNIAAAMSISWCLEAADVLGVASTLPPVVVELWRAIIASPYTPLTDTLSKDGPVHQEYTGYNGSRIIQQADVALLQYPLNVLQPQYNDPRYHGDYSFPLDLARRDLDYWLSVTDMQGMFTGDTVYSAAYLALGNTSAANDQMEYVWSHLDDSFFVPRETDTGGTHHFITGAGSFLQVMFYGYPGLRIAGPGVLAFASPQPTLPPYNISAVKLRGVHLGGSAFDFWYNATTICANVNTAAAAAHASGLQSATQLRTTGAEISRPTIDGWSDLQAGLTSGSAVSTSVLRLVAISSNQSWVLSPDQATCLPVQALEVRSSTS